MDNQDKSMDLSPVGPETETETSNTIEYTRTRIVEVDRGVLRRHRIIAGYEPGTYVDSYKVLRTRILQKLRDQGWNTFAVTSPNPNAGKTVNAINLAIGLAMEIRHTALVVDANLRDPAVHRALGHDPHVGLTDFLLDRIPIEDILVHPQGIQRFVVLPGTRPLPDAAELLSSPRMAGLANELKQRYSSRIVVYDLPHLETPDALAFAPLVDAVLLVVEAGKTTQDQLMRAIEHLQPTPILGIVLNKSEDTPGK